MAIYRIFPESDSFIFSEFPISNAGKDEILELGGYTDTSGENRTSRILIKFSDNEITDVIENKIAGSNWKSNLGLYLAEASEIPTSFTIFTYPLSTNFVNGTGRFGDQPINKTGVSWLYRNEQETEPWTTSSFITNETGSFQTSQPGGGTWLTGSSGISLEASQSFNLNSE